MPRQASQLFVVIALLLAGASAVRADIAPPRPAPPRPAPPQPEPKPVVQPVQSAGACDAVPIYSIDGVHLEHGVDAATLTAVGTTSTAGWHDAALRFTSVLHPDEPDATATYEFVACPPEAGAEVLSPVTAAINLVLPLADFHYVVIKAKTNEQTLDLHAPSPRP
jgi:hypothetical protein